jgi:hypothetical protein
MPNSLDVKKQKETSTRVSLQDMRGHGASSERSKQAKAFARAVMLESGRTLPDGTRP